MENIYCKEMETGEELQVLSFVSCQQNSPYSIRAICVSDSGTLHNLSIAQIKIIMGGRD